MSCNRRVRRYQEFLKSLKRPESTLCSCPAHLHPRSWVPPPCLTSRAQEEENIYRHQRTLSDPELRMHSSTLNTFPDNNEDHQKYLKHLYKEQRILKEALDKVTTGDVITKDSRKVVKKWSKRFPKHRTKSEPASHGQSVQPTEQLAELDKSFAEALQEEENLKQELEHLRAAAPESKAAIEEENRKLKKKIRQLQHRMKRQEEAQCVSRESLHAEREMGTREEYILLSLKKKYDDLLQYVLKVESENQKLKSLHGMSGDGDEFLHDYDRGNTIYESRAVTKLQADLESLHAEMIKKDTYIGECEQHLQAMEALKEENLALHKSLRNTHDNPTQPDPRDISRALEEEWMKRLAETREMYERAIEGYRDQLDEMQEKFQRAKVSHVLHINELVKNVDDLKIKNKSPDGNSTGTQGSNKLQAHDDGNDGTTAFDAAAECDKDSTSFEEGGSHSINRQRPENTVKENESGKNNGEYTTPNKPGKTTNQATQTVTLKHSVEIQTNNKSEDNEYQSNVLEVREEMQESKEYLERVNRLVKKLESMKLNGEGAEAILSVIRDTINDCLHEWRESFQQQKSSQRDSAEENKEYVELQRKLRSKSKQLEAKQKQCKHSEEQNSKLIQQCSQMESKISALEASDRLGMLQDLPQTLRNTEEKLSEFQDALARAQGEKNIMEDQIKHLGEKLKRKENKLASEHEQVVVKEEEIKRLKENFATLKHELDERSQEVSLLKEQLSTKDTILEHTSTQLEERIRECASLASQIDRQKIQLNQEARNVQVQLNEHENSSHKQLMEAQAQLARYQAQMSALRSEKDHNEKSLRHSIRKCDEQIDQLQLRNSTLQRELTTITSTYHSMFASGTLGIHGIGNVDGK